FAESVPETRIVPSVVGMSWPDAANRIGARGLCFDWETVRATQTGARVGRVVSQRPRPGTRVPRLTRVRLNVAQRDEGQAHLYLVEQDPECPDPAPPFMIPGDG
ncbi:MAG TPA: PASTA domain-containing protein, partial [Actinomycetota bacterium]|nr:PASTA domain-containing protein [Actinomycetota bacterium]